MPVANCTVEGCERVEKLTRGWCRKHYQRWQANGDPLKAQQIRGDHVRRFWTKVDKHPDGCWLWTASTFRSGYGSFRVGGRTASAHRWIYEHEVGAVPEGLDLDHTCHSDAVRNGGCEGGDSCRHRRCVNPAHLEPVTQLENTMRGESFAARNAEKTHCPQGHPYAGDNLYVGPNGDRLCRECQRANSRRYNVSERRKAMRRKS